MLGPILLIFGVLAACASLAFVGARIGVKNEAPTLAAGMTEQSLRGGMTPSVLGGLLGTIPFIIFVVILIWQALAAGAEEAAREAREAAEAAAEARPAAAAVAPPAAGPAATAPAAAAPAAAAPAAEAPAAAPAP